jgi:hypothetical protein
MPIDHWMMFGTFAEQRHFVYPSPDTYQPGGAIINGNMAAYAPDGLAAFLLERTGGRLNYIIDPLTHAFQHNPNSVTDQNGKTKKSIQGLAIAYGEPCAENVGKRPLLPRDLQDDEILASFTKNCLAFQKGKLSEAMANNDVVKYVTSNEEELRPYALIAPYFYMTESTFKEWLPVCQRAIRFAGNESNGTPLFASVVISQGVILNGPIREEIAQTLKAENVSGFIVWIDELDEQEAGATKLKGLLELARSLREGDREVINLHGGYFSVLAAGKLGEQAMSGVCHGPEFGECRSVVPVGGGIPMARYYLPHLHTRVRYRDVLRLLNAKGWLADAGTFHTNVCDCLECKETLDGNVANFVKFGRGTVREVRRGGGIARIEYPIGETKLRCLKHYLQRKSIEYRFADTASEQQIREDLERGRDELINVAGLDGVSHLNDWLNALS